MWEIPDTTDVTGDVVDDHDGGDDDNGGEKQERMRGVEDGEALT